MRIDDIFLKIIFDSRRQKTLKATMKSGNIEVNSSIPQGKSTGEGEVYILEPYSVIRKFEMIKDKIIDVEFSNLKDFDNYLLRLDGTENKSNLGGNLILVLSQTFCRLAAKLENLELWQYLETQLSVSIEKKVPFFLFNLINGGKHAVYGPKIQEYMIVPQVDDPKISLEVAQVFFTGLKEYFKKEYGENKFGDEGGLLIFDDDYEKPLKILNQIKKELNLEDKVKFSLDIAASSFYDKEKQIYLLEKDKGFTKEELGEIYKKIISEYDIFSLEDPFEEKDWESFQKLVFDAGNKTVIIGDDLTVTNPEMVKKLVWFGIDSVSANIDAVEMIRKVVMLEEKKRILDYISQHPEKAEGFFHKLLHK